MAKTVQIRDVDDATYEKLRARATQQHLSLAQYLRRQLDYLAAIRTMEEILDEADRWRTEGGGVPRDAILQALDEGRAERG